jgi:hypothetical protein
MTTEATTIHMKKVLFATTLGMACISAFAQGTLTFANAGPGCVFRIFPDSTTPASGSSWMADLYWASGTVTDSTTLAALNAPAPFDTGAQAGYFTGGQRTIPGEATGNVITVQVRVWNTAGGNFATWAAAQAAGGFIGESILTQITLGGPPGTPPYMTGLNGTKVFVLIPEPSGIALAGLGLVGMTVFRRRK